MCALYLRISTVINILTIQNALKAITTNPNQKNYRNGVLQKRDAIPMSLIYGVLGQLVGGCFRNHNQQRVHGFLSMVAIYLT